MLLLPWIALASRLRRRTPVHFFGAYVPQAHSHVVDLADHGEVALVELRRLAQHCGTSSPCP
jgi:hypothetical protein